MPRPYSVDLRERVMRAVTDGGTIAAGAQQFSVSVDDAISDWKRRQAATQSLAPAIGRAGRPRALSATQHTWHRDRIDAVPDATIDELQAWLAAEHGIVVGWGTVWRAVDRLDRRRKKRA